LRLCPGFGVLGAATLSALPTGALAYRPFDSTDPAVAGVGEFEVELSPLSYRHGEQERTWIVPQLRLNYGFAKDWEVVLEGQGEQTKGTRGRLIENALSVKTVVKEGSLQDKQGASAAIETGLLLPGVNDENGLGASITGIVGEKFSWGAVHVNLGGSLTRDQRSEIFFGTILEGPDRWAVRPVAEFVFIREAGGHEETALLGGAIWQVKDGLAFDIAIRHAENDGRPETEFRAGLTFSASLGKRSS
jgi:hypothetical protein